MIRKLRIDEDTNNNSIVNEYSVDEIASTLYDLCADMDVQDYADTKSEEISQLEGAIGQLQAMAQNKYNKDYWRTLWNCLQSITSCN